MTARRGFTLLEVMISLAILAVALVALADLNGGAVQMGAYARRATQATLLLRGKMIDLEDQLQKDGFSDYDDEKRGTFEDESAADYAWRAEILKPDVQLDASALLGLLGIGPQAKAQTSGSTSQQSALAQGLQGAAQMLGGGGQAGGMSALAQGPMAGMLQTQAQGFIETLKKSVREVRVTVSWKDGSQERSISASQEIVILPEMVGQAGATPVQAPTPGIPGATGAGTGTTGTGTTAPPGQTR
jgi:general secretion pathway protein I